MVKNLQNLVGMINENRFEPFSKNIDIVDSYNGTDWKYYIDDIPSSWFNNVGETTYIRKKLDFNIFNWFEVFIIVWNKGSKTRIHDHAEKGCILKVLHGQLKETIYRGSNNDLKSGVIKISIMKNSDTSFMHNDLGLHSIENINDDISISLHIYSPCNHKTKYI
jgi:predicted metal-dependent enzyme (double-stranded beta helix superfamily)